MARAFVAGVRGVGEPGPYNLAGEGLLTIGDVADAQVLGVAAHVHGQAGDVPVGEQDGPQAAAGRHPRRARRWRPCRARASRATSRAAARPP